jgi:hypothetical protein
MYNISELIFNTKNFNVLASSDINLRVACKPVEHPANLGRQTNQNHND